jgi:hypothetical protein
MLFYICKHFGNGIELRQKTWKDIAQLKFIESAENTLKKYFEENLTVKVAEINSRIKNIKSGLR